MQVEREGVCQDISIPLGTIISNIQNPQKDDLIEFQFHLVQL